MKTRIKRVLTQMVSVRGVALILLFLIAAPASGFSGSGAGTVADPYQITNATQLQEMKDNLNAHYVLMNDIDCSDTVTWNGGAGFEPVGYYDGSHHVFRGTFDGQGYVITELYINRPSTYFVGLFGEADQGSIIKNIGLEDVNIAGGNYVGGLVAYTHYATISNCHITGDVTGTSKVGGLALMIFHSTVSNSYSTANVTGDSMVGGLAGYFCDGQIINCYSTGNVNGTSYVGGLIGGNGCSHNAYIYDSYSTGDVNGTSYVGGLMGHSNNYITISNSYSTGSVTGISDVGGLVGKNDGTITNCYYNNHSGNPSVGIGSGPGDCTAIGNNESYFYYSSDPPMDVWDFVNIWGIDEGVSYPYLLWQPPSIIFVDADATSGANNGSSWSNAYLHLQDALADANSNPYINNIRVAEGTYKPDANTANPDGSGDREATFQLLNGVALYGGFPTGGGYWESRDTSAYPTTLSGDLDGNDVPGLDPCDLLDEPTRGENSYHVLIGSWTDPNAVLDGFTITAGNANGTKPSTNSEGGGMRNYLGGPTVVNCTFSENSAADAGGGMDNDSGDAIVINCTFSRNSAVFDGGGMCNDNYDFQDGSPTVTNCTFNENLARWGGGMSNYDDSKTVVSNCIFSNNSAKERGGGMDNDISTPTIVNCTFSGNSAGTDGGGMDNTESAPTVINCTFVGNSAINEGGGICDYNSSPTVTNCILWANTALSGAQIYDKGTSSATVSYSAVQGDWSGMGNIDEDPLFIDPNGLDGIGGTADDEENNVHLRGHSPCINAGDPGGDYGGQVDLDRQPRVAYGRVDMGADEVFPISGDFEPDGDVDFADFAIFANHWLMGAE